MMKTKQKVNTQHNTERKQAEEALQAEKNTLQSIIDAMDYGITILDTDYNILYQSTPLAKTSGYHLGEKCYQAYEGRDTVCDDCPVEKAFKDGKSHTSERKQLTLSGEFLFLENTASPIRDVEGKIVSCLEVTRDTTEYKEAEELYSTLTNSSPVGVYIVQGGKFQFVNPQFQEYTGFSQDELLGKESLGIVHPEDRERVRENAVRMLKGKRLSPYELRYIVKNGEILWATETVTSIHYRGKRAVLGNFMDITEQKRAEEAFERQRAYFQQLFDNSPEAIVLLDTNNRIVNINKGFETLFGYTMEEIKGQPLSEVIVPEDRDKEVASLGQSMRNNKARREETVRKRKDGSLVDVALLAYPIWSGDKVVGSYVIYTDITERKRAEEGLRKSEERYRNLFEGTHDMIQSVAPDGHFIFANRAWLETMGYTEAELPGLNLFQLIHPESLPHCQEMFSKVMAGESVNSTQATFVAKDGRSVIVEGNAVGRYVNGKLVATQGIFRDITEHKKADEELELRAQILDSVNDTIFVHDADDNFIYVNEAACRTHGYSREEFLKMKIPQLVDPERARPLESDRQELQKKGKIVVESAHLRKDGSLMPVEVHARTVGSGKSKLFLTVARDITERKQAEEALKQKMEELQIAYQKLKELDQMKDSFLSTVSHELRTPLTSIKSFSEILLNYDEDRETQKEFLNIIKEESDRLTRLINNFLDLSKIEAGRMQWETVELLISEVIKTAINATQALAAKTNLKVTVEVSPDLPTIMCDKDRLVQVVTNLLSNAIKFTPEGGRIQLKTQILKKSKAKVDSSMVMVSVSDSGIGIAAEDYKNIFEKFKQVGDTLTDKPQGTGLGLPICKEIIEHYGGNIWVESELGKGSTFFFTLPVTQKIEAKAPEVQKKPAKTAAKIGKTILVVDNEAHIRRFLRHELTNKGYHVLEASGGKEAIELARKNHPDMITLDVLMPDLSGFDVTAVLKNDPDTKDIPILIVSVTEDKEKAYQLGANDYVTKPFTIEALVDKINLLLRDAQKSILVVDDDKALVKSLKYELDKRDYATYVAYNGKEALAAVKSHLPDLIILDIMMPEMDGYEVMKALKQKPETANISVVVMTGIDIDGGRVRALSVGATEYLTKSGGFDKMFKVIENILYSKSSV